MRRKHTNLDDPSKSKSHVRRGPKPVAIPYFEIVACTMLKEEDDDFIADDDGGCLPVVLSFWERGVVVSPC